MSPVGLLPSPAGVPGPFSSRGSPPPLRPAAPGVRPHGLDREAGGLDLDRLSVPPVRIRIGMVRFLHTGDWQLGMTRRFLPAEAQARYTQDRLDAVERLGRLASEENCRFRVVSRTLAGRTFPFESLSGGAREQISLLTRVACAQMMAPHEGIPLILDDALGYTGPERLRAMGTILARAARKCRILILTRVPDRYLHAGPVKRIPIP